MLHMIGHIKINIDTSVYLFTANILMSAFCNVIGNILYVSLLSCCNMFR